MKFIFSRRWIMKHIGICVLTWLDIDVSRSIVDVQILVFIQFFTRTVRYLFRWFNGLSKCVRCPLTYCLSWWIWGYKLGPNAWWIDSLMNQLRLLFSFIIYDLYLAFRVGYKIRIDKRFLIFNSPTVSSGYQNGGFRNWKLISVVNNLFALLRPISTILIIFMITLTVRILL